MIDEKIINKVHEYIDIAEDDNDDAEGGAALRAILDENIRLEDANALLQGRLQKLEFVERFIEKCGEHGLRGALALARGRYDAEHKYAGYGGETNTIGGRPRKAGNIIDYLDIALEFFWANPKTFLHWCDVIARENSKSLVYRVLKERFG
jgi:hypothetical protein